MKLKTIIHKISILPKGIRYKLLIAFSLMSVIPLLVIGYLMSTFILLEEKMSLLHISMIILLCMIISYLGLVLARNIIERVIDIAVESKIIAERDYTREIPVDVGDEIGQIGESINLLTRRLKENINELKDYQEKTKEINLEIQRKMLVLSDLMQVGELISSHAKLEDVIKLILTKLADLYETGFAVLFLSEDGTSFKLYSSFNIEEAVLLKEGFRKGEGILGKTLLKRKPTIMDSSTKFSSVDKDFKAKFKYENAIIYPVVLVEKQEALLVVGNNEKGFTYTNDDLELVKLFAKQLSIALESDILSKKAKRLSIKDTLTDLFSKTYIMAKLNEEIERAIISQRPCSFILLDIDDFKKYEEKNGKEKAEEAIVKIGAVLNKLSGPLSKAGRIEDDAFALVLPEINKKEALEIAEKIRKQVESVRFSDDRSEYLRISAGVSENPIDGTNAEELFKKAEEFLLEAKRKGKNKVVG